MHTSQLTYCVCLPVHLITCNNLQSHILQVATDIAAGMAHVHSRNIVHGDLTPANVLLKSSPGADSGYIAKVAGKQQATPAAASL
jgi:serine/threonine protein kinase